MRLRERQRAIGQLILADMKALAWTLGLDEELVLAKLIACSPKHGREQLKAAIRAARGGH